MSIFFLFISLRNIYMPIKKNIHVSSFQIKNESFDKPKAASPLQGGRGLDNVALVWFGLFLSMISTLFVSIGW